MSKFRKKPVVIEALHLTEEVFWESKKDGGFGRLPEPFNKFCFSGSHNPVHKTIGTVFISIPTLEGTMRADLGDWIIKGIKGEFYPCKPDIFEKTYEPESAKPPASEGVREALESMLKEFRSGWNWDRIVPDNDDGDQTLKRLTRLFQQAEEALAALPELEKRECENCKGWAEQSPVCRKCNGRYYYYVEVKP